MPPAAYQAFTIAFNGLANRIITDVEIIPGFDPAAPPNPLPTGIKTTALWDTGASNSVISRDLAHRLGLTAVGKTRVNHAGGFDDSPTYLVNFGLPNRVGLAGIIVTEFPHLAGSFEAIIGMDILMNGDFAVTHVGQLSCMSFRVPSVKTIDYVLEANKVLWRNAKRNEPCPCGKGQLFKHCHEPIFQKMR